MKITAFRALSGLITAGAIAAVISFAPAAQAASITYSLNVSNGCCGAAPYGSVKLTENGANEVDFEVTLNNPNQFIWGGQAGAFAFNLNLPASSVAITLSQASINAGFDSIAVGGTPQAQHMDGFGSFNYAIRGDANHTHGGSQPIGQSLTFKVVNTSGTLSLASFNIGSTGGDKSSLFAADILNNPPGGTSSTGFVGTNGVGSTVPEPATLAITGLGIAGLVWLRKRKR